MSQARTGQDGAVNCVYYEAKIIGLQKLHAVSFQLTSEREEIMEKVKNNRGCPGLRRGKVGAFAPYKGFVGH